MRSASVRYRIHRKLADGGMAEIFLASQLGAEEFEKQVVLKRILPNLAADIQFVRMFLDEAHIASTLNHSNIVQVLDLGRSSSRYFLVLEFIDGWNLDVVRRRGVDAGCPLPLSICLYVFNAVCRALHYAHTRSRAGQPLRIVHRDVSPHNVLISREGDIKLSDFGIAKAIDRKEKSIAGIIKGKIGFMSPEQSLGQDVDHRSDLFSAGTLLYLLTVGEHPFEAPTEVEVLSKIREARYAAPSQILPDFNSDVEEIIRYALKREPDQRWDSAEAMSVAIEEILARLPGSKGAGPLKRYLRELGDKDGIRPPGEISRGDPTLETIEPGGDDIELEAVTPLWAADTVAATPRGARAGDESEGEIELISVPVLEPPPPPPAPSWRSKLLLMAVGLLLLGGGIAGTYVALTFGHDRGIGQAEPGDDRPRGRRASDDMVMTGGETDPAGPDAGASTDSATAATATAAMVAPAAGDGGNAADEETEEALLAKIDPNVADLVMEADEAETRDKLGDGGVGAATADATSEAVPGAAPVRVSIRSVPAGAIVRSKTKVLGRTPFRLNFRSGYSYKLWFTKKGFKTATRVFRAKKKPSQKIVVTLKKGKKWKR